MTLRVVAGTAPQRLFENPSHLWAPAALDEAVRSLEEIDAAVRDGYWIAGGLTYEFGALLHGAPPRDTGKPLLLIGAYERANTRSAAKDRKFALSAPLSRVARDAYGEAIARIVQSIRDGNVYQVNFTVPFDVGFEGDALALFDFLTARAAVPYAAYLEYGDRRIVSISPELFLEFDMDRIVCKPMKGTAALDRIGDLHNEKNRAEHLMIVDLLRNDFHRFCDDVRVDPLFEIERYPTFATMISRIEGRCRERISFERAIRSAFPCGSVTGAPKRAAIAHIAHLERDARDFYTGTIGFLGPDGRGVWNVPIRTLQIDASSARYDCGGGIVSDSVAASEWDEIVTKTRFLQPAIAGFSLLETFRSGEDGALEAHLARMRCAAADFALDFDEAAVRRRIAEASRRPARLVRVRASSEGVAVTTEPLAGGEAVEICYSSERVRSADRMLRYKTAWRPAHDRASREASQRGCFDALLLNERGEITEGARTNVFARIGGALYTPPLSCGLLPGILRSRLVSQGDVMERVLTPADLERAEAVFVGNSARGLLPARLK